MAPGSRLSEQRPLRSASKLVSKPSPNDSWRSWSNTSYWRRARPRLPSARYARTRATWLRSRNGSAATIRRAASMACGNRCWATSSSTARSRRWSCSSASRSRSSSTQSSYQPGRSCSKSRSFSPASSHAPTSPPSTAPGLSDPAGGGLRSCSSSLQPTSCSQRTSVRTESSSQSTLPSQRTSVWHAWIVEPPQRRPQVRGGPALGLVGPQRAGDIGPDLRLGVQRQEARRVAWPPRGGRGPTRCSTARSRR